MRTEIMYATECALTVYFDRNNEFVSADWREHFRTLSEAIFYAESILNTQVDAERIVIWDANTGEILAECFSDEEPISEDDGEDWNEDDWDDCDYEVGYDPYLGCFAWDE